MKSKVFTLALVATTLFSCGSKKSAPAVTETAAPSTSISASTVAEGQNLYTNSCGRCHKLYAPTAYSKADWAPILVRMQKKAKLDDAQMASVTAYIHSELK